MRMLLLALALAVPGCAAYERSGEAELARSRMLGLRDDQLRQCAGHPSRIERRGEAEIWVYESGGEDARRGATEPDRGDGNTGLGAGESPIPSRYCLVRLFLENQRVTRVSYSGVTGGVFSLGEQCAFVVANCIK